MRDGTHAAPAAREFGTGLRAHIERVRELERQRACRELLWAIEAQEFSARLEEGAARTATAIGEGAAAQTETPLGELLAV